MRFLGSQCFHFCFYLVVAISQVFCKTCPPLRSDTVDITCDYEGDLVNCGAPIVRGTRARLACKESFTISTADDPGYRELNCLDRGLWDHPLFSCISEKDSVKKCPALSSRTVDFECMHKGEKVSCESGTLPGTTAQLSCKEFYKILFVNDPGYREITCLEDGVWDHPVFNCSPECGTNVTPGVDVKVNGTVVKHDKFPWRINLYKKNSTGSYIWITDATLLSPDLVLIQARPLVEESPGGVPQVNDWALAAGDYSNNYNTMEPFAQRSLVKSFDIAKGYNGNAGDWIHNVAMIRLEKPFAMTTLVRPVCVDWSQAVGFSGEESQDVTASYIPYEKCRSQVVENEKRVVTDDTICTDCKFDLHNCTDVGQGGSFICKSQGLWYLMGRLKRRPPVKKNRYYNSCEYYYVYVKVGRYLDWIRAAFITSAV